MAVYGVLKKEQEEFAFKMLSFESIFYLILSAGYMEAVFNVSGLTYFPLLLLVLLLQAIL